MALLNLNHFEPMFVKTQVHPKLLRSVKLAPSIPDNLIWIVLHHVVNSFLQICVQILVFNFIRFCQLHGHNDLIKHYCFKLFQIFLGKVGWMFRVVLHSKYK